MINESIDLKRKRHRIILETLWNTFYYPSEWTQKW